MLDQSFFYKRFSIGLALDTSLKEFNEFLDKYSDYINNFYFSLPMGDKFHARTQVIKQMHDPKLVDRFWQLLDCIRSHNIKMELVLNNGMVNRDDVKRSARMLHDHGVNIDLVGITDDIYNDVKSFFPTQRIVYSFKNHTHTEKEFAALTHRYDEIVLGRQNIRNTSLFSFIKQHLHADVVLLLNNGCSHVCGGCTTLKNCHRAYYQEKFQHSPEYLYALQSLMPFEIHTGLLDVSNVHLFKISSRNASLKYIKDCLDSYLFCEEDSYIKQNIENYMLWSRLAWHTEYFNRFSLARIRATKEKIYQGIKVSEFPSYVRVILDLRNQYLFQGDQVPDLPVLEENLKTLFGRIPVKVEGYLIGVSNCANLLSYIYISHINSLLNTLSSTGRKVYFSVPPLTQSQHFAFVNLWNCLKECIEAKYLDCLVVNDIDTESFFKNHFQVPIAFGERLTKRHIQTVKNDYLTGNEAGFGKDLIDAFLREEYVKNDICFILCNMPGRGMCISPSESVQIHTLVGLVENYDGACPQSHEKTCDGKCMTSMNTILKSEYGDKLVICANSVCDVVKISDSVLKTVLENRACVVIPSIWRELL